MNALTLTPVAAASRRTCLASWSCSEIVVRIVHIILELMHITALNVHPPDRGATPRASA